MMPTPRGISADNVRQAIAQLGPNQTIKPFGLPTRFWLHAGGRLYAPKAVLGLARQIAQGGALRDDFTGGDGSSGANTILRRLGFKVEAFREPFGQVPRQSPTTASLLPQLPDAASSQSISGFWWVNQRQSYREERAGGYLWAPLRDAAGHTLRHWEAMTLLAPGDVVFHYANGAVRALGIVTAAAQEMAKPVELPENWDSEGRRARLEMTDLEPVIPLGAIPLTSRLAETYGPFDKNGDIKQAYLFPVSRPFAEDLIRRIGRSDLLALLDRPRSRADRQRRPRNAAAASDPVSPRDVGATYRDANESAAAARRSEVTVDLDKIDRGLRGHARTQNALAAWVRASGLEPLRPVGAPNYDLAWRDGPILYVAEVKSLTGTNEVQQLRLGLGQVLDYNHVLTALGHQVEPVLAVERQPTDERWMAICRRLGVTLVWPGGFAELGAARLRRASGWGDVVATGGARRSEPRTTS